MYKTILFSALIVLGIFFSACTPQKTVSEKTDIYTRVMQSGTIRCGYEDWPPMLQKDANTGQFSGVGVDLVNEIAKRLKLKIVWAEEFGIGTQVEGVTSGRVDMICLPIIITMPRIRVADFSVPVVFSHHSAWVKKDSAITDTTDLNDPKYSFVYIDGSAAMAMTERLFPKTRHLSLPEMSPTSDLFLSVLTGKADAVYSDTSNALTFAKNNPDKIRPIYDGKTDIYLPWAFMTGQDNYRFVKMINMALDDMKYDGTLAKILQKNNAEDYFTLNNPKMK